ncbi:MAG: hypothetical protein R8M46_08545 [Ghiorsea sp.]
MKRVLLSIVMCFLCIGTAAAANIADRADALKASVQDNQSYDAHMARELSLIAEQEKAQNEINVANAFMSEAEKHAAKAGAK